MNHYRWEFIKWIRKAAHKVYCGIMQFLTCGGDLTIGGMIGELMLLSAMLLIVLATAGWVGVCIAAVAYFWIRLGMWLVFGSCDPCRWN